MNSARCPRCEKSMPETAHFCTNCGESVTSPEPMSVLVGQHAEIYSPPSVQAAHIAEEPYRENIDDIMTQELVDEAERHLTWHKELEAPIEPEDSLFPPRPSQAHPVVTLKPLPPQKSIHKQGMYLAPPSRMRLFSVGILLLVVIFSILFTVGRGFLNASASPHEPTLQASSSSVALGATLTLHGSNFSPNGIAALSRDALIPIVDTGYLTRISVDARGNFTDTITISAEWLSGMHTVNAEDAVLHKIARFPLFITGNNAALRPAHLNISATALNMGEGDFATHSTSKLTLTNVGSGQITWQGNTDQAWLQITPKQGVIADLANTQVTIAVDRSHMELGSYTAHLNFISNAGNSSVVVKMSVVPLNAGQDAVLAVSPAVLAFTATDGGNTPAAQTIAVSNLGVRPLPWSATTNASWLTVSPGSGVIQNASSSTGGLITSTPVGTTQTVRVGVNTSTLLPGTYSGIITFTGQGTQEIKDSPQSIEVTITINPQCVLQTTPAMLSFASAYGQAAPASQSISVGVSQGCTKTMTWSATTGAQWLQLNTSNGTTPTSPTVSINTAGLKPGTYSSAIVFTTSAGTDTLPVTFTLGQPTNPIMNVSTNTLTYNGVVGQTNPTPQNIVLTNSAGGVLNWQATFAATTGGNWLSIAPASGSLTAHQSVTLVVTAQLAGLVANNTYGGAITISGTDGTGHTAVGSPQMVQVSVAVQAACSVSSPQTSFAFSGIVGQAAPAAQALTITASGACLHSVVWSVTSAAAWLSATPSGTVTLAATGNSSVSVSLAGLVPNPYNSSLILTANDSVTNQAIGVPITIPVTLQVLPACSLAAPSVNSTNFSTEVGQNPATQTFTIAASGSCNGNVTVTPAVSLANGTGWLSVSPPSAAIPSGGSATFTVTVLGSALTTAGPYSGSIALNASNGGGVIVGSPQNVAVTVAVAAAPVLTAAAGAAVVHSTNGVSSQPVDIANTGGTSLNWSATLTGAPSFVGLSSASGTLAAGGSDATNIVVTNAAGVVSGSYTASVTLTATDAATGAVVSGSPVTVPITIDVAQPSMQLNTITLNYSTTAGTDPNAQSLTITNSGGATLTWTAGPPSDSWVTLDSSSGSDESNVSSTITFTVHTAGLSGSSPYSATVLITPSTGPAVTVTINLTISPVAISPTPTPSGTTSPTPTSAPTPTPAKSSTLI